jgi:hypothetical protein
MGKELTTHIKEESKMLNQAIEISARAIEISKSIKDEKFKWILERIVEDERNHHKILKELFEIIKKEAKDWDRYFYELTSTGFP